MKGDPHPYLGHVKASTYRKRVLTALEGRVMCPKEISEKVGYPPSHVSSTLSDLAEHGLVVCTNPDVRKGRLYCLTGDGTAVCAQLVKYK